jgi:predicted ATPase
MEHERAARAAAFGELLRRHRLAAGLSQAALAERARMSARGIGALERGDRRTPQRETLTLIVEALDLSASERDALEAAANPIGSRGGRGTATAGSWPAAPSSNLPLSLTSFIGREAEVTEIAALLRQHRLVTLTGPGGIGKTRTALQSAAAFADAVSDGTWLVELGALDDPARVIAALASALGVQEAPNHPLLDVVLAFLEQKRLLVVVDNCEHVIDAVRDLVANVLRRCPAVRVLTTSREPLNVPGERRYLIAPLPFPPAGEAIDARSLLALDAPRLFAERAAAADRRFSVTDENAPHVAEICRRLDGIPLALELAAARVRMFTVNELAVRLDDRFRILTNTDRTATARQRTIQALVDWSYDLLSPPERALFRALSIFAGGFTAETAAALHRALGDDDATLDLLTSLVDKSLVQVESEGTRTRYRLLETVQQDARRRLVVHGEHPAAAAAHAAAMFALAQETERHYGTEADAGWYAFVRPELENWRSALAWSMREGGDVPLGLALLAALRWVWIASAQADGRHWARTGHALTGATTPAAIAARLDLLDSHTYAWLGRYQDSYDAAERAVARMGEDADPKDVAEANWRIGNALVVLGRASEGEARLRGALATYRERMLPKFVCWVLVCVALARASEHDTASAKACYAEALALAEVNGFRGVANVIWGNLAEAEFRGGDAEAAVRCAVEALAGSQLQPSPLGQAIHLANMTAYLVDLGRFDEARGAAREALELSREVHAEVVAAVVMQHLAATAALRSRHENDAASEDRERAARILGYVDARFAALKAVREFTEAREYDAILRTLVDWRDRDAIDDLMNDGALWSEAHAVDEVLSI